MDDMSFSNAGVKIDLGVIYARYREQVAHENTLYNQRIVWLISMQAFLFAAMALVLQAKLEHPNNPDMWRLNGFGVLLCCVGISVALIANTILGNARRSLTWLKDEWTHVVEEVGKGETFGFPHVSGGGGKGRAAVFFRSGHLPHVFVIAWSMTSIILLTDPRQDITKFVEWIGLWLHLSHS